IGSVFGITIRVHMLFLVMMGFFLLSGQPSSALTILLLFGLVFLHELGHSLVAQALGIRVLDITFWPLGGMARMSDIPENSRTEALIAIAGPAVNFLLAGLATPLLFLTSSASLDLSISSAPSNTGLLPALLGLFIWINLALGLFNLVPAFPMDGGRILRAFLGRRGNWVEATARAVRVGRFFALAMVFGGLAIGHCMLPIVGIWLWWVGGQELMAVRARHGLFPFGNFFGRQSPGSSGPEAAGGEPRSPGGSPFTDGSIFGGQAAGQVRVRWRPRGHAPGSPPHPDQLRPDELDGPPPGSSQGFSDDDLRRLENQRGPLRKRPGDDDQSHPG
ncbi:MAG: site-2 protease family protein, partial [Planctomycetota bacterium]|nr:site-2 protease family protein [Planctomycetota bacterium]